MCVIFEDMHVLLSTDKFLSCSIGIFCLFTLQQVIIKMHFNLKTRIKIQIENLVGVLHCDNFTDLNRKLLLTFSYYVSIHHVGLIQMLGV